MSLVKGEKSVFIMKGNVVLRGNILFRREITGNREIQGEIISEFMRTVIKMSILKKQCEGMQGCTKLIKRAIQYRAPPNILGMATGAEPAHI